MTSSLFVGLASGICTYYADSESAAAEPSMVNNTKPVPGFELKPVAGVAVSQRPATSKQWLTGCPAPPPVNNRLTQLHSSPTTISQPNGAGRFWYSNPEWFGGCIEKASPSLPWDSTYPNTHPEENITVVGPEGIGNVCAKVRSYNPPVLS